MTDQTGSATGLAERPYLHPGNYAPAYRVQVPGTRAGATFPAPLMARSVLGVVLCGFFVIALLRLSVTADGAADYVGAAAAMGLLLVLQVGYFARPHPYGRWRYAMLAGQGGLIYVPMLYFGESWIGLPGFFGASLLLVLPRRIAWAAAGLVVLSVGWFQAAFTGALVDIAYSALSAVITMLVTWGLTRLAQLVVELQEARVDLARLEVSRERLRIARDLHDVLGSTLTAVTLRTELVRGQLRSPAFDSAVADSELADVARLSRQALTEVRTVSAGTLRTTFVDEIRHAAALLDAADVSRTIDVDVAAVPVSVEPTLAAVLREAVTNVLRHGGGGHCGISLHRHDADLVLEIVNDLPEGAAATEPSGDGHGLANLAARLAQVGGSLSSDADGDAAGWHLSVTVPAKTPSSASPMDGQARDVPSVPEVSQSGGLR